VLEKRCPRCDKIKLASEFVASKRKCGVGAYCKPCNAAVSKEWREKNREKYVKYCRKRYRENRQYYRDHAKRYYKTLKGHFTAYRSQAKIRDLVFGLSCEEFEKFLNQSCFYCGLMPEKGFSGIDRKDSSIGYTLENCISCCGVCNLAKQSLTIGQFLEHVERIYKYRIAND
jgi:hypothetical protein